MRPLRGIQSGRRPNSQPPHSPLSSLSLSLSLSPRHHSTPQGIDLIAGGRNKKTTRTAPKSDNVYIKLLVKVS
jgi:large subunit ribosomal protein L18e